MKNITKILTLAGALTLGGCSFVYAPLRGSAPKEGTRIERSESKYQETMDVLGLSRIEQVSNLGNGYFTSRDIDTRLRALAGVYAGTIDVKKTETGFVATGTYSQFRNPDAMEKVCIDADVDKNKIIDAKEQRDLTNKIYSKYANK